MDMAVLKEAQAAAAQAMADPDLVRDPCFPLLRRRIRTLFRDGAVGLN